jgi:Ca2+-binding EF-hand superfamily protein
LFFIGKLALKMKEADKLRLQEEQFARIMDMPDDDLRDKCDALFAMADTNHSGSIDWTEFVAFCTHAIPGMTKEEMLAEFKEADITGDEKIEKEELYKMMVKKIEEKRVAEEKAEEARLKGEISGENVKPGPSAFLNRFAAIFGDNER